MSHRGQSAAIAREDSHDLPVLPTFAAFEAGDFDPERFDHSAHLFMAWRYLARYSLSETIRRYRAALLKLTDRLGVPDKYHETMTLFYLYEIAERIDSSGHCGADAEWPEFVVANSDLFAKNPPLVRRRYTAARLDSGRARRQFLLPDRAA